MKYVDLSNVAEPRGNLPAGGYICKITKVEDFPNREYLRIEYDIAQGQYASYYLKLWQAKSFWGGSFIKSYKETALIFFKEFVTAVENSNEHFKFDCKSEQMFVDKLVGLVLAEEEYTTKSNEVKTRLYVAEPRSVQNIKDRKFNKYELKKLKSDISSPPTDFGTPISDDEYLPF